MKILILGATGAMGKYLVPLLAEAGHQITAVALEPIELPYKNVQGITGNILQEPSLRRQILAENYDAIVDFMIYPSWRAPQTLPEMLQTTGHYIYLSTYRIYADEEHPIKETSPRLIDATKNVLLKNSDDYCIFKARGENILRSFERRNWTIIRPAITYSLMRYQLVTLEARLTVGRARAGKAVVLPIQAKEVQGTMSWAGDVAKMIAGLLFNDRAYGETFTVATAEHHSWGEIADYYKDICNLKAVWVDKEDYIRILDSNPFGTGVRWQLEYDRLFHRIMDNSKILAATGMKQDELMPLYKGLEYEIGRCPKDTVWPEYQEMDEYLKQHGY
ncbi:MAG: NAD(P)H-binding protein [Victivallales bacterium]|nr:NAD(P)H-binding protein [Victivallales bacterium]